MLRPNNSKEELGYDYFKLTRGRYSWPRKLVRTPNSHYRVFSFFSESGSSCPNLRPQQGDAKEKMVSVNQVGESHHAAGQILRVAFLIGADDESSRESIEAICKLSLVAPVAVLMDTEHSPLSRRLKNLRRNIRVDGWKYLLRKVSSFLRNFTERLAFRAAISPVEAQGILRLAFPELCFNITELGKRYDFPVYSAGNLNGSLARELLSASKADLGIVLGTRVLRQQTFSIPRFGCINLHKGKVPEYRGVFPGFWELVDGTAAAGVTVHFVDSGIDTGDILVTREVPIARMETPATLIEKLNAEGTLALCEAVSQIQNGSEIRRSQVETTVKPRPRPSYKEVQSLRARLPYWKSTSDNDGYRVFKNLYALVLYYSGGYALVRAIHRLSFCRGAILLYHRINNYARDPLTTDTLTFASHLLALSKRYPTMKTLELVRRIRAGLAVPPTTVIIHFDDCYQDIYSNGAPLLATAGFPATAFINSGFVDTTRVYPHDAKKYAYRFPNLTSEELREWVQLGFEVGNHTMNHVDLGVHAIEEIKYEIRECEKTLQSITGQPISLFSFPFGQVSNIQQEAINCIRESGYVALFSAHGGFVTSKTDAYDVPRLGAHGDLNPLVLLLEVEGVAPHQIASWCRAIVQFIRGVIHLTK